jgi:hypothetical protein
MDFMAFIAFIASVIESFNNRNNNLKAVATLDKRLNLTRFSKFWNRLRRWLDLGPVHSLFSNLRAL